MTRTLLPRPARRPRRCGALLRKSGVTRTRSSGNRAGNPGRFIVTRARWGAGEEVPRPPLDLTSRVVERGEERATRAGALPRPVRRPRRRVQRRRGVVVVVVVGGGNRRAKAGVVVVVSAGAPVGPGARAPLDRVDGDAPLGPPPLSAVDPEILRRLDERLCARARVAFGPVTIPAVAARRRGTCRGENRQAAPAVGAVQAVERVTPPARVGRRRVVRREASRPRRADACRRGGNPARARFERPRGRPRRSVQILRRRARLSRSVVDRRAVFARASGSPSIGSSELARIGALIGALFAARSGALGAPQRTTKTPPTSGDDTAGGGVRDPPSTFGRRAAGSCRRDDSYSSPDAAAVAGWTRCWKPPDSGGGRGRRTRRAASRRRIRPDRRPPRADAFAGPRRRRVAG